MHSDLDCTECHSRHDSWQSCLDCHTAHTEEMDYDVCLRCHTPMRRVWSNIMRMFQMPGAQDVMVLLCPNWPQILLNIRLSAVSIVTRINT